ncbi:MAG: hypothetical protein IPO48_07305 [Saprospiraceae bacterium]|nr:hypothetical protein [Saprospiraceae bacterium]
MVAEVENRMMFTCYRGSQPTAPLTIVRLILISLIHDSPYSTDPNDASGDYPLGTTVVVGQLRYGREYSSCCMNITVFDNTHSSDKLPRYTDSTLLTSIAIPVLCTIFDSWW